MDRLEALGNSLSQMTIYDIKSYYNQVCGESFVQRFIDNRADTDNAGQEHGHERFRDGSESEGRNKR